MTIIFKYKHIDKIGLERSKPPSQNVSGLKCYLKYTVASLMHQNARAFLVRSGQCEVEICPVWRKIIK